MSSSKCWPMSSIPAWRHLYYDRSLNHDRNTLLLKITFNLLIFMHPAHMNSQCCSARANILTNVARYFLLRFRHVFSFNVSFYVGGFGTRIFTEATEEHSIFIHVVLINKSIQSLTSSIPWMKWDLIVVTPHFNYLYVVFSCAFEGHFC